MPDFRRGSAAITAAQESNKGGNYAPFVPNVIWKDDREEKYILFLNPADEIPTVELHEWIVVGQTKNGKPQYESFISRKDTALGEDYDDIEDRLGQKARLRTIGVAVELEPTFETVKGRQRPTGFQVKTENYERKISKDSDDKEEVTAPVVGFIVQSPQNFYGWVGSFNESTAPIEETPLHVLRRGKDANTAYDFTPYIDQPVDFSGLLDYVENVNYLRDEEDLASELEGLEPLAAALSIGGLMLEKRLEDLCDKDRYDTLVGPVEELENKFGPKPAPKTTNGRTARPARQSPRVTNGNGGTVKEEAPAEEVADDSTTASRRSSKFAKLRAEVEG